MKKLTALILSAAIAPPLALSTAALAEERDDDVRAGEQRADEQQAGEQRDDDMLGSKQQADEQRHGDVRAGEQRTGEQPDGDMLGNKQQADEQRAGGQLMSGTPAGAFYADDVIGNTVKHRGTDEDVGEIQDLVIGQDGRVVGFVVTTGGFLGLGGQDIGLGWDHIEHTMEDDESVFYTDMDEEALRNAPEYERD